MATERFLQHAHLLLGITRAEFVRRLEAREVDPEVLRNQIEHRAQEVRLEALCEKWIELRSLEQIDKFSAEE